MDTVDTFGEGNICSQHKTAILYISLLDMAIPKVQDLKIESSRDGSQTLYSTSFGQHYHSMHGALAESEHVFIKEGLNRLDRAKLKVLEFGFGSGLNALLTLRESIARKIKIEYIGLELHPVPAEVWSSMNYNEGEFADLSNAFTELHESAWEVQVEIHPLFQLLKRNVDMTSCDLDDGLDLVYFDAFGPGTQPELWTKQIFARIYDAMSSGGVLTTYSCKGDVRRSMMALGFNVAQVGGPPGKRSMLVAIKD